MKKVVTSSGFTCELPENSMDDMELVDLLCAEFPNESFRESRVLDKLLGNQKKALYDHLREDGRVPASAVHRELMDIFTAFNSEGKNS